MTTVLGVDCGMTGALAFYDKNELIIYDMPVHEIKKGKTKRKRIDPYGLLKILRENKCDHVYIEQVSAQPGNGAAAAFTFGFGCGALECAVAAAGLPFTYVTPQKWKKAMACPKEKDGARMRASQLLPEFANNWSLKKHHGRAESALIALYGYNNGI